MKPSVQKTYRMDPDFAARLKAHAARLHMSETSFVLQSVSDAMAEKPSDGRKRESPAAAK